MEVPYVYTDGGCISSNPSKLGGTWAYVLVNEMNVRVQEDYGCVTPSDVGMRSVSNNLAELLAVVCAMEALPDGWSGTIYTDSSCTMVRIRKTKNQAKLNNIPEAIRISLARQKSRLGAYNVSLVAGHPTKADLARGNKNGTPVSIHNAYCDRLCCNSAKRFLSRR